MNEPKIIDRGTAAKLWAEGDDRVAVKRKKNPNWDLLSHIAYSADVFPDTDYEFALIDPEPEIVKPVVVADIRIAKCKEKRMSILRGLGKIVTGVIATPIAAVVDSFTLGTEALVRDSEEPYVVSAVKKLHEGVEEVLAEGEER